MNQVRSVFFLAVLGLPIIALGQGALEPAAPPGPVMKTLDQVEPRRPISAPVTISVPGSYYLADDIDGGIEIQSSNVDLDLNGFTVDGSGAILTIAIENAGNVRVGNGTVRGASSNNIRALNSSSVILENLRVVDSAFNGIRVANHSGLILIRNTVVNNAPGAGIRILNTADRSLEAVIESNVVHQTTTSPDSTRQGLIVGHVGTGDIFASVSGNRVFNNQNFGIVVTNEGSGSAIGTVTDNVVHGNATGLRVNGEFVTSKNIAHANGNDYDLGTAPNAAPVSALGTAGPWDNIVQ